MDILEDFLSGKVAFIAKNSDEAGFLDKLVSGLELEKPSLQQEIRHEEELLSVGIVKAYAVSNRKYIFTIPNIGDESSLPMIEYERWVSLFH